MFDGLATASPAGQEPGARTAAPVVTRAALAPALVAGRGATVAFDEQEAENVATDGKVIGPDRTPYTLASEASGRSAVQLAPGQHVECVLPRDANALTVRYSIPDAPEGGGITAPLDVGVDGRHRKTMTLTSQYSWLYNQYPFTNDGAVEPEADLGAVQVQAVDGRVAQGPADRVDLVAVDPLAHVTLDGEAGEVYVPAAALGRAPAVKADPGVAGAVRGGLGESDLAALERT